MSYLTDHPRARWIAPAAAVALIAGGALVAGQATADDPTLPPRTAEDLLVDLQEAEPTPMSGTVVQTANLGLPELPALGGQAGGPGHQGSADFGSLVSGTHTLRLWYDGPDRARVALVGSGAESDLIRNGSDVWIWSSAEEKAVHYELPDRATPTDPAAPAAPADPAPSDLPKTPEEAAELVLDKLDPSTTVTTDGTASIAGRSAYELVLEPRSDDSLVEEVRIAIDAEEGIPLRVQVNSTKIEEPAFEVGFTDIDFSAPEPRMFEFDAPPGTTVTEGDPARDAAPKGAPHQAGRASEPTVVGDGWSAVAIWDVPKEALEKATGDGSEGSAENAESDALTQALDSLPQVSGAWGSGRLLSGTLFSAVLTDDGRLAVGMVAPATLYDAL